MLDPDVSRKNCLQWGLRVLPPRKYYKLLKRHTKELFPCAYETIVKAHSEDREGYWWWKSVCCYISKERMWFNIATARWVSEYCDVRIGIFASWAQYETFREALREATEEHFNRKSGPRQTVD